jgi:hypothetical protein
LIRRLAPALAPTLAGLLSLASAFAGPGARAGASAQPVGLADFAFAAEIRTQGEGAVYALDLTPEVYGGLTRADLGDLRVFDGAGQSVPLALAGTGARGSEPSPKPDVPALRELPIYPLKGASQPELAGLRLRIEGSEGARRIELADGPGGRPAKVEPGASLYLVDARAIEGPLDRLEVRWEGGDFLVRVELESSDDLERWRPLLSGAVLADLHHAGRHLRRDAIALPATRASWLRLRPIDPPPGLALTGVRARAVAAVPSRDPSLLELKTEPGSAPGERRFGIPPALELQGLRIRLAEPNTVVEARLESRRNADEPWRLRQALTLYRLSQGGIELENGDLAIGSAGDLHWRLSIDPAAGAALPPAVTALYRPRGLRFLARGPGPHRLAWGSAKPMPAPGAGAESVLYATGVEPRAAQLAPPLRQPGAETALVPPRPWGVWLLWSVLAVAALLTLWMAYRLFRQMERPAPPPGGG